MRISTGFVRASVYDSKVRRVLFAIKKDIKLPENEILRAAAELNKKIFEILQEKGADKRDVVRITCDFDIEGERIIWKWDTLKIEIYKESEEIGSMMSAFMSQIEEEEAIIQNALDKLKNLAEKIREIVNEIEGTIEELKRKRDSIASKRA